MPARSQSAVEYLMTYGWAIVAIAVALGVMYSLGIFGSGASPSTGCTVITGFSCTKPVLYSSGALSIQLGQIGQTKTITATGCSANDTPPTTWQSTDIALGDGQITTFWFQCPLTKSSTLGSVFSGTLWVTYTTQSGGGAAEEEISTVTVPVGIEASASQVTIATIPITLSNMQSSPTGSGFQQMITINPQNTSYTPYEASDLGNIRFYQSGTELHSWCESGCASSSSGAVFWVNIPGGIAANSNVIVNMTFQLTATEYDGVYAGEAPQLSSNYGQYDNGGNVFPSFYQNFSGTTCPAGDCGGSQFPVVNNGISVVAPAFGTSFIGYSTSAFQVPGVLEIYGSISSSGTSYFAGIGLASLESSEVIYDAAGGCLMGSQTALFHTGPPAGNNLYSIELGTPSGGLFTLVGQYNYNSGPQATLTHCPVQTDSRLELYAQNTGTVQAYWMRVRAYPPNGVMPTPIFYGH